MHIPINEVSPSYKKLKTLGIDQAVRIPYKDAPLYYIKHYYSIFRCFDRTEGVYCYDLRKQSHACWSVSLLDSASLQKGSRPRAVATWSPYSGFHPLLGQPLGYKAD